MLFLWWSGCIGPVTPLLPDQIRWNQGGGWLDPPQTTIDFLPNPGYLRSRASKYRGVTGSALDDFWYLSHILERFGLLLMHLIHFELIWVHLDLFWSFWAKLLCTWGHRTSSSRALVTGRGVLLYLYSLISLLPDIFKCFLSFSTCRPNRLRSFPSVPVLSFRSVWLDCGGVYWVVLSCHSRSSLQKVQHLEQDLCALMTIFRLPDIFQVLRKKVFRRSWYIFVVCCGLWRGLLMVACHFRTGSAECFCHVTVGSLFRKSNGFACCSYRMMVVLFFQDIFVFDSQTPPKTQSEDSWKRAPKYVIQRVKS